MSTNDREQQLRDAYVEARGFWSDTLQSMLEVDPDFFEAYLNFSAVPWRTGALDPKLKELVYIAVDGAATHLYEPGLRMHIRRAIELGATKEELRRGAAAHRARSASTPATSACRSSSRSSATTAAPRCRS